MIHKNLSFLFSFLFSINVFSQTLVNTEWVILSGAPDGAVEWSSSTIDNSNNLLETGNTFVTNEGTNILTAKKDKYGQVVWEKLFDGTDSSNDYGIAIMPDASNNVYVAGATHVTADDAFDYVVLKYNSSGTLQWQYIYAGTADKNDLPIAVLPDENGNVYVTGLSESNAGQQDILTLKLSPSGTLLWEARYDYAQLPDLPAGIEFDNSGNIVVAGGSAKTADVWEIVTLKYSPSGSLLEETRVSSTTFEQPRAFAKDSFGNFYITGQTGTGGTNPNIKTIKLDSNLTIVWEKVYDGKGFEDMGHAIAANNSGDVYVTGYSKNSDESQDIVTIRYKSDGTQEWHKNIKPLQAQGSAQGKKIAVGINGNITVAGETQASANPDMIVLGYDASGNKLWHKLFSHTPTSIESPTGITLDGDGNILITGISKDGASASNFSIKYAPYARYRDIEFDEQDNPLYWKSQIIVGFGHDQVIKSHIDDKDKVYGEPYFYLDSASVLSLYSKLGKVFEGTKFVKVFPTLETDCGESIDRFGRPIPVPPFWSTFVLDFPPNTNVVPLLDSLRCLFPLVRYAHLNYAGDFSTNDPRYGEQASLHPTGAHPEGHINVEPAWEVTTGSESVRVGVFDTGVEWRHEDFLWQPGNLMSSVVAEGWDFGFGVDMKDETLSNPDYKPDPKAGGHGTNVAGIIGAVSNNGKGVAGVAGGDKGGGNKGATLYSLRALVQNTDPAINNYSDLSYIADAIVKSTLDGTSCDTTYSYGIDIQNHSYGFATNQTTITTPSNIDLLKDAVHFAGRSQVVVVAAAGNDPDPTTAPIEYPASLNDDWVINVGGSGTKLIWHSNAKIGGIDVVAPYPSVLTLSTLNILHEYSNFSGTSCATPHVSGTAALLLSHNGSMGSDDVERVLELTADDIDEPPASTGIDTYTGYGRINACRALRAVELNDLQQIGPGGIAANFTTASPQTVRLELTDDYENSNGDVFAPGVYDADQYKVTVAVANSLPAAANIVAAWPRVNASNLFANYTTDPVTDSNFLDPVEDIALLSYTQDSAFLEGYLYELSDTNGTAIGWMPFPPDSLQAKADIAYTLMTGPGIGGAGDACDPVNSTHTVQGHGYIAEAFPNPTGGTVHLLFRFAHPPGHLEINLFNANGILVKNTYSGTCQHKELLVTDHIHALPPGLYFYVTTSDRGQIVQKIAKF